MVACEREAKAVAAEAGRRPEVVVCMAEKMNQTGITNKDIGNENCLHSILHLHRHLSFVTNALSVTRHARRASAQRAEMV